MKFYVFTDVEFQHKEDIEEVPKDADDVLFVKTVLKYGKPLLQKSQTPAYKEKKMKALKNMIEHLADSGYRYTEVQVRKKIENMKSRLKKKIDAKRTGNTPIELKVAEKLLMEAMDGVDNPAIGRLKCGILLYF